MKIKEFGIVWSVQELGLSVIILMKLNPIYNSNYNDLLKQGNIFFLYIKMFIWKKIYIFF